MDVFTLHNWGVLEDLDVWLDLSEQFVRNWESEMVCLCCRELEFCYGASKGRVVG